MAPPQAQSLSAPAKHIRFDDVITCFSETKPTRFTMLDKFFSNKQNPLEHSETVQCECGCFDSITFFSFTNLKLDVIKEFIEYCFSKNYIVKESIAFQNGIAKICVHGIYGSDDIEKRYYFLSELLTPQQLISYTIHIETKTYSLFDCLYWGLYIEEHDMQRFFISLVV